MANQPIPSPPSPATATKPGTVSTTTQTFAGAKTFTAQIHNTSGGYKFPDDTVQLTAAAASFIGDNIGYNGDPNDPGAPQILVNAPTGAIYSQKVGNKNYFWIKGSDGHWQQLNITFTAVAIGYDGNPNGVNAPSVLSSASNGAMYVDGNGVVWVKSNGSWTKIGAGNIYDSGTVGYDGDPNSPSAPQILSSASNGSLYTDSKGNIWIKASFGWKQISSVFAGALLGYNGNPNNIGAPSSLSQATDGAIYIDSSGNTWIKSAGTWKQLGTTFTAGAINYDGDPNSVNAPSILSSAFNGSLYTDSKGNTWIKASFGWKQISSVFAGSLLGYNGNPNDVGAPSSLSQATDGSVYIDSSGNTWIKSAGTWKQLGTTFTAGAVGYNGNPNDVGAPDTLDNALNGSLYIDGSGGLWVKSSGLWNKVSAGNSYDSETIGYNGNPNDPGAPALLDNAPVGSIFSQKTSGKDYFWIKGSDGIWSQLGIIFNSSATDITGDPNLAGEPLSSALAGSFYVDENGMLWIKDNTGEWYFAVTAISGSLTQYYGNPNNSAHCYFTRSVTGTVYVAEGQLAPHRIYAFVKSEGGRWLELGIIFSNWGADYVGDPNNHTPLINAPFGSIFWDERLDNQGNYLGINLWTMASNGLWHKVNNPTLGSGYNGNPNNSGAPDDIKNALAGSFYMQGTSGSGTLWFKGADGTWRQIWPLPLAAGGGISITENNNTYTIATTGGGGGGGSINSGENLGDGASFIYAAVSGDKVQFKSLDFDPTQFDVTEIGGSYATGDVINVNGSKLVDGDTFTISNGKVSKTFEFNSSGGVLPGNIAIAFTTTDSEETVQSAIRAAIAGVPKFKITTTTSNTKATGSITVLDGSQITDGQTITLTDGISANPFVFEFDSGGGVSGSHIAVSFTSGDSSATVKASLISAISGSGVLFTATAGAGDLINLEAVHAGTEANVAITTTTSFTVSGMSGGQVKTNLTNTRKSSEANATSTNTVTDPGFAVSDMSGGAPGTEIDIKLISGLFSVVAGTGISVSENPSGTFTVTNSDPASGISVVGDGDITITEGPANTFTIADKKSGTILYDDFVVGSEDNTPGGLTSWDPRKWHYAYNGTATNQIKTDEPYGILSVDVPASGDYGTVVGGSGAAVLLKDSPTFEARISSGGLANIACGFTTVNTYSTGWASDAGLATNSIRFVSTSNSGMKWEIDMTNGAGGSTHYTTSPAATADTGYQVLRIDIAYTASPEGAVAKFYVDDVLVKTQAVSTGAQLAYDTMIYPFFRSYKA